MPASDAIRKAVTDHNRDFTTRAVVAVFMGVATSMALYLLIIGIFFVAMFGRGHWFLYATGVFIVLFLIGLWSCRRGVDPLADVDPRSEDDFGAIVATAALTDMITSPRHAIAGAASIILHGPRCLLESIGLWRSRMTSDPATLTSADALLARLVKQRTLLASDIDSKPAAAVLLRTGLAKLDRTPSKPPALRPTTKGDAAIHNPG